MYAFLIPVVHLVTGYKANVRVVADSAAEAAQSFIHWSEIELDGERIIDASRKWAIDVD